MKIKISIIVFLFSITIAFGQQSYRKDSLQIKVYTKMIVNENLRIDSIEVLKVFCDYCNEIQKEQLKMEAIKRTKSEIYNPKYQKPGAYNLAHYLRISKKNFSELNSTH